MSEQEKSRALVYGLALGDALGYPIEFLKMDKITIIYGKEGIQEPPDPAKYSDETQTSRVVAETLIQDGEKDLDTLMETFTKGFVEWSSSPENTRHPGHTVTEAARTLEAGVHWKESGANARGNGSTVRMAPIGYFYQHDPDRLREVARAVGIATHTDNTAIAGSIAAAYVIKLALDGIAPEQYPNLVMQFTDGISEEFTDTLLKIGHVAAWTDEQAAVRHLGAGWIADEAVAIAIYCAIRHPKDFASAVQRAANTDGDSDSVGCITGGLVAAHTGMSGIPQDWINRLEHLKQLTDLADRLAAKKEKVYGA